MEAPRRGSYARRGTMLVRLDFILLSRHLQHDLVRPAAILIADPIRNDDNFSYRTGDLMPWTKIASCYHW